MLGVDVSQLIPVVLQGTVGYGDNAVLQHGTEYIDSKVRVTVGLFYHVCGEDATLLAGDIKDICQVFTHTCLVKRL